MAESLRGAIDAARKLGADIVIAVDVNYRGWEQDRPKNLIDTMTLTMNIPDWMFSKENEKKAGLFDSSRHKKVQTHLISVRQRK